MRERQSKQHEENCVIELESTQVKCLEAEVFGDGSKEKNMNSSINENTELENPVIQSANKNSVPVKTTSDPINETSLQNSVLSPDMHLYDPSSDTINEEIQWALEQKRQQRESIACNLSS